MQIVITLPDAYAEIIPNVQNGSVASKIILEAVKGGIVLPKNHGRLIDADVLEREMINGIRAGNLEEGYEMYANINNVDDCVESVRYSTAIIKADNESEE